MRCLFVSLALLFASIAWGQNGRDCSTAATVSDKTICSDATLKALDQQASTLWDDVWAHNLITQTEYKQMRAAWESALQACGKENPCLQRRLEERMVFIRSERIAQGLDRLPANARQDLAKLSESALDGLKTIDLVEIQPVVAPLAASVIGPAWLAWAESDVSPADGGVEVLPGGRWLISRGSMIGGGLRREIWLAIDRSDCQLWIVRLEQDDSQPKPEIRWASTAAGWPATVAKLFAENGLDWSAALKRQVGLPATRVHK